MVQQRGVSEPRQQPVRKEELHPSIARTASEATMHGNEGKSEPSKSNNATTIHKAMHPTTYGQALRNSEREDTTTVTDTTADTKATAAITTTANNCTAQPHLPAFERNAWRMWSKADKQCSHRDAWIGAQGKPSPHAPCPWAKGFQCRRPQYKW